MNFVSSLYFAIGTEFTRFLNALTEGMGGRDALFDVFGIAPLARGLLNTGPHAFLNPNSEMIPSLALPSESQRPFDRLPGACE
jgi:hypothetical protein